MSGNAKRKRRFFSNGVAQDQALDSEFRDQRIPNLTPAKPFMRTLIPRSLLIRPELPSNYERPNS